MFEMYSNFGTGSRDTRQPLLFLFLIQLFCFDAEANLPELLREAWQVFSTSQACRFAPSEPV